MKLVGAVGQYCGRFNSKCEVEAESIEYYLHNNRER